MSDEQASGNAEISALSALANPLAEPAFVDPLVDKVVAGRYRVKRKLGEGGMGTVYLAEHVTIEKEIALKVLLQEYARKADLKERFLREAKAAASIGHENIIDITDFGETPDRSVFFAMEFLNGRDLSHAIKSDGSFSWQRAKPILLQICRALGAAHSKDIIHRDMKPENIFLIEREGRADFVKVLDFGIAKVSGMSDGERLTRTGMIFGTPEYMSPEQAQGHHPDHRVDIYAVGVIMYELLTGEVPFKADTFMGILTKHIFENPTPPSQLKPDLAIPADAEAIVMKAMAKDREERFKSMTEMASAITRVSDRLSRSTGDQSQLTARRMTPVENAVVVSGSKVHNITANPNTGTGRVVEPIKSLPPGAISSGRSKLFAIIVSAVVLIGGGVAVWALSRGDDKPQPSDKTASKSNQTKTPVTPTKVPHVTVSVTSSPSGAAIYKGEEQIGVTPADVQLKRSKYKVLLKFKKAGYEVLEQEFQRDQDNAKVHVKLTKKDSTVVAAKVSAKVVPKVVDKTAEKRRERERRQRERALAEKRRRDRERRRRAMLKSTKTPKTPKTHIKPKTKTDNRVDRGDLKNPFQ